MAIVVGSPTPATKFDALDILITVQMEWQTRCRCPFATKSGAELYDTLQWRLLCSYSMTFVSQMLVHLAGNVLLTM